MKHMITKRGSPIAEVAILLVHERRHSYVTRFLISHRFRLLTRLLHVYSQQRTEVRGFLFSRFLDFFFSTIACGTRRTLLSHSHIHTQSNSDPQSDVTSHDTRDVTTSLLHTTHTQSRYLHAIYTSSFSLAPSIATSTEISWFRGFVVFAIFMYM